MPMHPSPKLHPIRAALLLVEGKCTCICGCFDTPHDASSLCHFQRVCFGTAPIRWASRGFEPRGEKLGLTCLGSITPPRAIHPVNGWFGGMRHMVWMLRPAR
ncbi:hypothetical protein DQ04_05761040 [Trypanosoma grayi]|uniref:hypothetical protein n=1 Tax=Trypanosoma grayi TaxID=71804 RepID=UPI0004F4497E|nr:hypothetical protein DQ04_05761040 [Trypanosoma grayi]KEG09128.1 hypothetical protein DQ04_05761040 [Trypanosoma grayi]